MGDGFNFKQLKTEILERSRAKDWDAAKAEWRLVNVYEADEPDTCLCGHHPIVEICSIKNSLTNITVDVGNVCVKRFLGFRPDLIAASLKRIRIDKTKSICSQAIDFFHGKGILSNWEHSFLKDTIKKRILSTTQLDKRVQINEKIVASINKRGVN